MPADPFAGFLPPDDATGKGDGFLTYTVAPDAGLANGTDFDAIASIVFDTEAAIATPTVTNTLDAVAPTSQVAALPATTSRPTFVVGWTAADDANGSGLADEHPFHGHVQWSRTAPVADRRQFGWPRASPARSGTPTRSSARPRITRAISKRSPRRRTPQSRSSRRHSCRWLARRHSPIAMATNTA